MSAFGKFRSLDAAIRESLWQEPDQWLYDSRGRYIVHEDGLELICPVVSGKWVASRPLGYIKLSWYTRWTINALLHHRQGHA